MLFLVSAAFAQEAPAPAPEPAPAEPAPAIEEGAMTVIKGEYLKPDITVIISRENLNKAYDLRLDESFLDKIKESVKQPPF